MRYLIARVEETTSIDGLRQLGAHIVVDAHPANLDAQTETAVAELAERERWDSDRFEVVRIPLEGAERLSINAKRGASIGSRVGPV